MLIIIIYQWRIQDFPQGGAPTQRNVIIIQIFCWKLHENERIWTPGGARPWRPPLDPPMYYDIDNFTSAFKILTTLRTAFAWYKNVTKSQSSTKT